MLFNKKKNTDFHVDYDNLPDHIGIIMDGNGRWAKKRGLPRSMGHREGAKVLEKLTRFAGDIGIKYINTALAHFTFAGALEHFPFCLILLTLTFDCFKIPLHISKFLEDGDGFL